MQEFQIELHSVRDVKDFVSQIITLDFEVRVTDERHWCNGRSFMEMFSLNLRRPLIVSIDGTQEEREQLHDAVERFLSK